MNCKWLTIVLLGISCGSHHARPGAHNESGPSDSLLSASAIGSNNPNVNKDSSEQLALLKEVYRWHAQDSATSIDFDIIVKDSFQTGIKYDNFNKKFAAIKHTNYFSSSFIDNYKAIADYINYKLTHANPKYFNEINFPSQEADPWTGFQDDFPYFWDKLTISDYHSNQSDASLTWTARDNDWTSEKYAVRFLKEGNKWRVAYLEGFDLAGYKH